MLEIFRKSGWLEHWSSRKIKLSNGITSTPNSRSWERQRSPSLGTRQLTQSDSRVTEMPALKASIAVSKIQIGVSIPTSMILLVEERVRKLQNSGDPNAEKVSLITFRGLSKWETICLSELPSFSGTCSVRTAGIWNNVEQAARIEQDSISSFILSMELSKCDCISMNTITHGSSSIAVFLLFTSF